ncbi:MAG: hypothetical protein U9Q03_05675 [Patescibacteria group bacterium]|nr:hypothetical protein [Patescibacteria group bacterium]
MGVSFRAISNAEFVSPDFDDEDGDKLLMVYPVPGGDELLDGKQPGVYRANEEVFMELLPCLEEWYNVISFAIYDCDAFHLGVCCDSPFCEILPIPHEGAIGPTTAVKLAKDFAEHRATMLEYLKKHYPKDEGGPFEGEDGNAWWLQIYDALHKACKIASDDGFLIFT